jgi:hypothetical protein
MARSRKLKTIAGPDGHPLTIADLPSSHAQRWFPLSKAKVVTAVRGGLIGVEEVCRRYRLTSEEFENWQSEFERDGIKGLRVTRIKNRKRTALPKE